MAPMVEDDLVPTLSDSDAISDEESEEAPVETLKRKREVVKKQTASKKRKTQDVDDEVLKEDEGDIVSDFEFDNVDKAVAIGDFDGWAMNGDGDDGIEKIIRRRKGEPESPADDENDENEDEDEDEDDEDDEELEDDDDAINGFGGSDMDESDAASEEASDDGEGVEDDDGGPIPGEEMEDDDMPAIEVPHPDDIAQESDAEQEDVEETKKQKAFFAPEELSKPSLTNGTTSFTSMSLSRPIMKGLSQVGFTAPTPIQAKTIPVALAGKDIVGGAVTGSGKTGAFILPILERLLYRPKRVATTRVAILMPTRELALQCLSVAKKLAAHTDITFGRAIGGLNSREQEKELKLRPDIVIATPGRFIDFMRNSASFNVDKIEILVLDEADRMLEEGFSDELNEILKTIPKSRQTMLFSATMTSRVDDLVRVGLQRPVRIMVDAQKTSASGLVQEFVRLRPGREAKRLGYLMHLCSEVHRDRVIIFFRQKKDAHRVRVVFALCGLKAAELHGSMSQEQRINAIESFRSGRAAFLLATDLASRGLDIKGIETVINYEAPQSHEIYLHRVGRTARAGRKGISCTLAAEPDRKVVKAAVKAAKTQGAEIRQRTIDPKDADRWQQRCDDLEDEIEAVLREEKEDKVMQQTEREITRAENVVKYEDEIKSRPKKTWFESEKEKLSSRKKGFEALNGPRDEEAAKKVKGKNGKLSNKEKKKLQDRDDRKAGKEWKKGKTEVAMPKKIGKTAKGGGGKPKAKKGKAKGR